MLRRMNNALRAAREAADLTQDQLAKLAELPQPTISRLESGQLARPSWYVVSRVSAALGLSPALLFGGPRKRRRRAVA